MRVTLIGEVHCVRECHVDQARVVEAQRPDVVLLEMLPAGERFDRLCRELLAGTLSIRGFRQKSEIDAHWGPSSPYAPLLQCFARHKVPFGPLDHPLARRRFLARLEKRIILAFQSGKDVAGLLRRERFVLFQERDAAFCRQVIGALDQGAQRIVAIMGANHLPTVHRYLTMVCGGAHVSVFNLAERFAALGGPERPRRAIAKRKLLEMDVPPLVPVNSLLYEEVLVALSTARRQREGR